MFVIIYLHGCTFNNEDYDSVSKKYVYIGYV